MNKMKLIEVLAEEQDISRNIAREIIDIMFDSMTSSLSSGDRVEIRGFGSFKIKNYGEYKGRNPKTGEIVSVKAKKLPFFKVGKELKERVDYS